MHIELRMAMIARGQEIAQVFTEHTMRYLEAHRAPGERPEPLVVEPTRNPGDTGSQVFVAFSRKETSPHERAALYYAMALSFIDPRITKMGGTRVISFEPALFGQG